MKRGIGSFLYTLDAKSFPPPSGDLVNYGELGTPDKPSDKRDYIEKHGSFHACFCYNTRIPESNATTPSGKRIFVSTLEADKDPFVPFIKNFLSSARIGKV